MPIEWLDYLRPLADLRIPHRPIIDYLGVCERFNRDLRRVLKPNWD